MLDFLLATASGWTKTFMLQVAAMIKYQLTKAKFIISNKKYGKDYPIYPSLGIQIPC